MTDPKSQTNSYWSWDSTTDSMVYVVSDITPTSNPSDFRWEMHDGVKFPIYTGLDPASSAPSPYLPPDYLTGLDRGAIGHDLGNRSAAEAEAAHYATVNGRDIYIPTQAEIDAAAHGMTRDATGFYQMVGGKKVYETGDDNGFRFHYDAGAAIDPVTGQHFTTDRRPDDDARFKEWVTPHGTNDELHNKLREYNDQLVALRAQYSSARADAWVVRENLLTRIRDMEDAVTAVNLALGSQPDTVIVEGPSPEAQYEQQMQLSMAFALFDVTAGGVPSFGPSMIAPPSGAHVLVALTVTLGQNRRWLPDTLQQPDCVSVQWMPPPGWQPLDELPANAITDEFVNGANSVTIIRDFLAPASGDTSTGVTETDSFGAYVLPYNIVLDPLNTPAVAHKEGDDGYFGAISDPTTPGGEALAKFMQGLCTVETHCNGARVNKRTHAFGKWQILPGNWPSWSKWALGKDPSQLVRDPITGQMMWPKTDVNIETTATKMIAHYYAQFASWRRCAIAWHMGHPWARRNPNAGLPGYGHETYSNNVLAAAGLPLD